MLWITLKGQQECLNKIRNYLSISKFDEYLIPLKGETVARLPKKLVSVVRGMVTNENPHPVNVSKIKSTVSDSVMCKF